jgi:hypothetical protein
MWLGLVKMLLGVLIHHINHFLIELGAPQIPQRQVAIKLKR